MKGRDYAVVVAGGCVLAAAFPEVDLAPAAWVALIPLLWVARDVRPGRGAVLGFVFGAGFFGILVSWISIVGWVAWGILVVTESLFLAAFGAVWAWLAPKTSGLGRVGLAFGAWAIVEYLRARVPVGGFTWGQLAQSQHDVTWVLRWASLGGGVVLAGVIAAVNAAIAEGIRDRRIVLTGSVVAVAAMVPLVVPQSIAAGRAITIAVVQGNVPDEPPSFEKDLAILKSHVRLTEGLGDADLVVWPESSVAIDPDRPEVKELLEQAATSARAPMIVGGNQDLGPERYTVEAFLVSATGTIVDTYRKTHLVPFGEYVPARDLLGWLPMLDQVPRDAVSGDEETLFRVAGGEVAPVLSFEGDFGSLVRDRISAGGRMVVVATNTSTWGRSWASSQHVAFSQVRAMENGVPVIHAAISGISAVIDEQGRVLDELPLYEAGAIVRRVRFATTVTPYARWGDVPLAVALAAAFAVWLYGRKVASPDA